MARRNKAFTLIELLVVIAIIALLIGILLPALGQARRSAMNVASAANLRSLNTGAANYAGDSDDRIFSYTWRGGEEYLQLHNDRMVKAANDQRAASMQAQNILQRATGRIAKSSRGRITRPDQRLMHRRYSHLVLLDYLTDRQPEPIAASPFDKNLQDWQVNPFEYLEEGNSFPYGNGIPTESGYDTDTNWTPNNITQLWPFASSFQMVPAAWNSDGINGQPTYVPHAGTPHTFQGGDDVKLGRRRMTQVAHPSAKVMMFEEFDRFTDPKGLYFAYPESKCNLAFFDGSVRQENTSEANPGWKPDAEDQMWRQAYVPLDTFPLPKGGLGDQTTYCQRYRWTRHGLQGVDYGGKDVGIRGRAQLIDQPCSE